MHVMSDHDKKTISEIYAQITVQKQKHMNMSHRRKVVSNVPFAFFFTVLCAYLTVTSCSTAQL